MWKNVTYLQSPTPVRCDGNNMDRLLNSMQLQHLSMLKGINQNTYIIFLRGSEETMSSYLIFVCFYDDST